MNFKWEILENQNQNNFRSEKKAWHSIIFFSKKLKSAESNYDTHDLKFLAIIQIFKHWRHYLKSNSHLIWMLINHVNLQYFFMIKKLNQKQTCWAEKLAAFNFYIEYQTNKRNLTDKSSRWLNYESANSSHTELLSMLQNKLMQDWMNSASDQWVTNEILSQKLLKKQNRIL